MSCHKTRIGDHKKDSKWIKNQLARYRRRMLKKLNEDAPCQVRELTKGYD